MIEIVCGKEAEKKPAKVFKLQLTNEYGKIYLRARCDGKYNYALLEFKEVDGKLVVARIGGIDTTDFTTDHGMIACRRMR